MPTKYDFEIEALHIAVLGIDETQKRGTPEHAKALELFEGAKELWHEQMNRRLNRGIGRKCPHCGKEL